MDTVVFSFATRIPRQFRSAQPVLTLRRMSLLAYARFSAFLLLIGCSGIATGTGENGDGGGVGDNGPKTGFDPTEPTDGTGPGSGGSPETLDGMFRASASTSVTPDSIYGLWAGSSNGADVRVRLTPTSVKIAKRCWTDDRASGGEVSARVSSSSIQVLESKSDIHANSVTRSYCNVDIKPISIPACTGGDSSCFSLKGTTLDIGVALFFGQTGSAGAGGPDRQFMKLTN